MPVPTGPRFSPLSFGKPTLYYKAAIIFTRSCLYPWPEQNFRTICCCTWSPKDNLATDSLVNPILMEDSPGENYSNGTWQSFQLLLRQINAQGRIKKSWFCQVKDEYLTGKLGLTHEMQKAKLVTYLIWNKKMFYLKKILEIKKL